MVVEHSVTEVVLFCVLIIVCLWCDLHAHQADKPVSARNAAIWSCIWVGLALVFAGYIGYSFGSEQVQLFLTGYLLEKSLSVDNLFVIMAIFSSFAVKDAFQHRVLYYGVLGAPLQDGKKSEHHVLLLVAFGRRRKQKRPSGNMCREGLTHQVKA